MTSTDTFWSQLIKIETLFEQNSASNEAISLDLCRQKHVISVS
jgi:hypothetical protein